MFPDRFADRPKGREATSQSVQKLEKKVLTPAKEVGTVPSHTEQTTINMRTKSLLFTAAIMAAGVITSVAQSVYSVNAVGYINLSLGAGFTLIANQLNGTNNNIGTILPTVPDGAQVLKWDSANQTFFEAEQYFDGIGWIPGTSTLSPGEGFFINLTDPTTVTLVGEVPQGNLTNSLPLNFSAVSMQTPQSLPLNVGDVLNSGAQFPATDGDQVLFWNSANQTYEEAIQYFDGIGWIPSDPTPAVGQGFFVNKATASLWTRSFSVN